MFVNQGRSSIRRMRLLWIEHSASRYRNRSYLQSGALPSELKPLGWLLTVEGYRRLCLGPRVIVWGGMLMWAQGRGVGRASVMVCGEYYSLSD